MSTVGDPSTANRETTLGRGGWWKGEGGVHLWWVVELRHLLVFVSRACSSRATLSPHYSVRGYVCVSVCMYVCMLVDSYNFLFQIFDTIWLTQVLICKCWHQMAPLSIPIHLWTLKFEKVGCVFLEVPVVHNSWLLWMFKYLNLFNNIKFKLMIVQMLVILL